MTSLWFPSHAGIVHKKGSAYTGGPASVSDCWAWFDAQTTSTITKDGSNYVTQVEDRTGNGVTLTASGTNGPTYSSSDMYTKAGLIFASNKGLSFSTSNGLDTMKNRSSSCVFMVFRIETANDNSNIVQFSTNSSSTTNRYKYSIMSGGTIKFQKRFPDSESTEYSGTTPGWSGLPTGNTQYVFWQYLNVICNDKKAYYANNFFGTGTELFASNNSDFATTDSSSNSSSSSALLGGNSSISSCAWTLGEMMIYSKSLSTSEINALIDYVKTRWSSYYAL